MRQKTVNDMRLKLFYVGRHIFYIRQRFFEIRYLRARQFESIRVRPEIYLFKQRLVDIIAGVFEFMRRYHYIAVSAVFVSGETMYIVRAQNKSVADVQQFFPSVLKMSYLSFGNVKYFVKRVRVHELVVIEGQVGRKFQPFVQKRQSPYFIVHNSLLWQNYSTK